jgi:hypothetical protein
MHDWFRPLWRPVRLMMAAGVVWAGMPLLVSGNDKDTDGARRAAVALNDSRASFHRIRRNPSVRVLWEEQDKILNHINLNGIADQDVVKLYGSVLDEIAQVQLVDRELDVWRVDKELLARLVEKSAKFLDISWKTARERQIPDRWLVRDDDLAVVDRGQHAAVNTTPVAG